MSSLFGERADRSLLLSLSQPENPVRTSVPRSFTIALVCRRFRVKPEPHTGQASTSVDRPWRSQQ